MRNRFKKVKPVDKSLLQEAAERMRMLSEYSFYIPEFDDEKEDDLLLGEEGEEDDIENVDLGDEGGEEIPTDDIDLPDEGGEMDMGGEEPPMEEPMEEPAPEPEVPTEPEVELDVTELVQGTEAAKASADMANSQISDLMGKFDELQGQLQNMSSIGDKIDGLEAEIEKRNPTPQEKLEMRSLDSGPFNVKLTDYWADKEDQYDVMGDDKKEKEEYVLTQKDVDDYNPAEIEDSFKDDYDEEDI